MTDPLEAGRTTAAHRVEFAVDWPPGHVAAYLLDADEPVLVDAGMPGSAAQSELSAGLAEADLEPADVAHVLVTHPHVDHVGQVPTLVEAADPTVYAPAGVRERFARDPDALAESVRTNAVAAGLPPEGVDLAVEMAVESLRRDSELLDPGAVDVWVEHGDRIDVGGLDVRAVHTPGHQADHLCYLATVEGRAAVLSGDMAMQPFRPVAIHVGLDDGVDGSIDAYYRALDRLDALDVDRVYPGHGPVHEEFAEVNGRYRASLDRLLETARSLLDEEPVTAYDLARERGADRDETYLVPESVSALAYLEARDEATVERVDGVRRYRRPRE